MASFRVGYGLANYEIIENISRVRCPANSTTLGLIAAETVLDDKDYFENVITNTNISKKLLYRTFKELDLDFIESETNFIFFKTGIDSLTLQDALWEHGLMIRPGADFGFDMWMRMTVGTIEDTRRVIKILKEVIPFFKR